MYKYISDFKNYSTNFYIEFKESDIPLNIEFKEPHILKYKYQYHSLSSNKITIYYTLESEQPQKDKSYIGDIVEKISIDIAITYKENNATKFYVTIVGGNNVWWSFSYECNTILDIDPPQHIMNKKTLDNIIKVLDKHSNVS